MKAKRFDRLIKRKLRKAYRRALRDEFTLKQPMSGFLDFLPDALTTSERVYLDARNRRIDELFPIPARRDPIEYKRPGRFEGPGHQHDDPERDER